jgi:hypothetical protein
MPDFQQFISDLQDVDMLKGDADLRNTFRNRYRMEVEVVALMLNDIGMSGGECTMHPTPPDACDFCQTDLHRLVWFVDGQTRSGAWANMCNRCFGQNGTGIGWGTGQLYRNRGDKGWQCIAGGNQELNENI